MLQSSATKTPICAVDTATIRLVIVSTKDRGGISVEQSLAIWQLYLNKLGPNSKFL